MLRPGLMILWWLAALSFLGSLVSLWFRDRARARLFHAADPFMRESRAQAEWVATYDRLLYSAAAKQRMAILRRHSEMLPNALRDLLRRYLVFRMTPLLCLAVMAVAGLIGNAVGVDSGPNLP